MDKIKFPFLMTISGSNGSGKTTFIKYLINSLLQNKDFKFYKIIIFSNTAEFTGDFNFLTEKRIARACVLSPVNFEDTIKQIMTIQKDLIKKGKKRKLLIIMDDIAGLIKDTPILRVFFTQNRHFLSCIIFSIQYICLCPSVVREISQFDAIFDLKTANSLQACYANYFKTIYKDFQAFKDNFINKLEKYQFFFMDRISDKRFILKCPDPLK